MGLCRNWGVAEIKERGLQGKEEERQETESLSVYDCDLKKMVISTKIKTPRFLIVGIPLLYAIIVHFLPKKLIECHIDNSFWIGAEVLLYSEIK